MILGTRIAVFVLLIFGIANFCMISPVQATDEKSRRSLEMLNDLLDIFEKKYHKQISSETMLMEAAKGMIRSADPYSYLIPPDAFEEDLIFDSGEAVSLNIRTVIQDGFLKVISPIYGTNACESGIRPGDRIIMIDGKPVRKPWEFYSKTGGGKIRTPVALTIVRSNMEKPVEVENSCHLY